MSPDRVRELIAQQRAAEARNVPPRLEGEPRLDDGVAFLGDVVAFVLSVTVLVYALLDTVIGVFVK